MKATELFEAGEVFFVLHGYINGSMDVLASKPGGGLLDDGWYVRDPGATILRSGPHRTQEDARITRTIVDCVLDLRTCEVVSGADHGERSEVYYADVTIRRTVDCWEIIAQNYYYKNGVFVLRSSQPLERVVRTFCAAMLEDHMAEQGHDYDAVAECLSCISLNAEVIPDPRMDGTTDCCAVPQGDIVVAADLVRRRRYGREIKV